MSAPRFAIIAVLLFMCLPGSGQTPRTLEITTQDFTKAQPLRSSQLSFCGVTLGQSVSDARNITCPGLAWYFSSATQNTELRGNSGQTIAVLLVEGGIVSEIVLQSTAAPLLSGDSRQLLTEAAFSENSPIRLRLLGREDSKSISSDDPLLKVCAFTYDTEGIELSSIQIGNGTPNYRIRLRYPAKRRE